MSYDRYNGDHSSKPSDDRGECPSCFQRGTWDGRQCSHCSAKSTSGVSKFHRARWPMKKK